MLEAVFLVQDDLSPKDLRGCAQDMSMWGWNKPQLVRLLRIQKIDNSRLAILETQNNNKKSYRNLG